MYSGEEQETVFRMAFLIAHLLVWGIGGLIVIIGKKYSQIPVIVGGAIQACGGLVFAISEGNSDVWLSLVLIGNGLVKIILAITEIVTANNAAQEAAEAAARARGYNVPVPDKQIRQPIPNRPAAPTAGDKLPAWKRVELARQQELEAQEREQRSQEHRCQKCNSPLAATAQFCHKCGERQ